MEWSEDIVTAVKRCEFGQQRNDCVHIFSLETFQEQLRQDIIYLYRSHKTHFTMPLEFGEHFLHFRHVASPVSHIQNS